MQLDSVRALKAEINETVVRPALLQAIAMGALSMRAVAVRKSAGPRRAMALGVARGKGGKDFRLAVRVQRRSFEADDEMIARITAAARQEVDVRYVGRVLKSERPASAPATLWHQRKQRPMLIGCSIAHVAVTAGTLGCFATHRKSGRRVVLSNNHVLANEDLGKVGDLIVQPGPFDGGTRRDRVGRLLEAVPMTSSGANFVDAAIASIDDGVPFDGDTLTGLGVLAGARPDPVEPGDEVIKIGRTTGLTRGVVTAIELDNLVVGYDRGALSFDNQIEIEGAGDHAFSAGGDSGSIILDQQLRPCALLFAGGDVGGRNGKGLTFANELPRVLQALNLDL